MNALCEDDEKVAAANNAFAFKLLKCIADDSPAQNIFISPYSASTVLQMVANGAASQTKTEMQQVLGTATEAPGLSDAALNQAAKRLAESLHDGNPEVVLELANAIWHVPDAEMKPDFIACNREFFGATIAPLDFADPHSVDLINHWASEKTHGRITHLADGLVESFYLQLFLANAVYFKGKWSDPFDAGDTHDRPFYLRGGRKKVVSMMNKSRAFSYRRGANYQSVRLPYQSWNLAMYVFLPDAKSSPEKLLGAMTGDVWRQTIRSFETMDGDLALPKFKLDCRVELAGPLQKLGMKTAFDLEHANLSGMTSDLLYISAARQKAFVEVTEEGTEAAAATGVAVMLGCMAERKPERFEMIVDRPFLFFIEEKRTGTILFIGVVYEPPASN